MGKDARIPMGGEISSLFINTCLNIMNPDLACLVLVTSANLMQQAVEDFLQTNL